MKLYRRYIRYFVLGLILAALVFGSVAIKATHSDTPPDTQPCQPEKIQRACDGNSYYHPIYIKPCPNITPQCPTGNVG